MTTTDSPAEQLGRMIREARTDGWARRFKRQGGITQTQLGELVGASQTMVSRWEKGSHLPSYTHLARLIDRLGLDARKAQDLVLREVSDRDVA